MTVTEFIVELEKAADALQWRVGDDGEIRGLLLEGNGSYHLEPLAAVCFCMTGMMAFEEQWPQAGRVLGLSATDCGEIAAAARDHGDNKRRRTLRMQLLQSLRLM
jgi:hypothetical protein